MTGNVAGRTKQVIASTFTFMYVFARRGIKFYAKVLTIAHGPSAMLLGLKVNTTNFSLSPINLNRVQVFQANDGPRYIKAFIAHIVVYGVQCAVIVFLRGYLMRRNALKRREVQSVDVDPPQNGLPENLGHKHAFDDMTDRENPDCTCFRISLGSPLFSELCSRSPLRLLNQSRLSFMGPTGCFHHPCCMFVAWWSLILYTTCKT